MDVLTSAGSGTRFQAFAQLLRPGRPGEQTIQQRAQVKSGAADDDRQSPAITDLGEHRAGIANVIAGTIDARGLDDIEEVVRRPGTLLRRGLRSPEVELAIEGYGVAVDDLSGKALSHRERKSRLAAAGGTENGNQQRIATAHRAP